MDELIYVTGGLWEICLGWLIESYLYHMEQNLEHTSLFISHENMFVVLSSFHTLPFLLLLFELLVVCSDIKHIHTSISFLI